MKPLRIVIVNEEYDEEPPMIVWTWKLFLKSKFMAQSDEFSTKSGCLKSAKRFLNSTPEMKKYCFISGYDY
jgi:hypothetical protein